MTPHNTWTASVMWNPVLHNDYLNRGPLCGPRLNDINPNFRRRTQDPCGEGATSSREGDRRTRYTT